MSAFGNKFAVGEYKGLLLGDGGYACTPWLLTPYLDPQTGPQTRYNTAHKFTRSLMKRTFGRWKRRFPISHSEIRMSPLKVFESLRLVVSCIISEFKEGKGKKNRQTGIMMIMIMWMTVPHQLHPVLKENLLENSYCSKFFS